MELGLLSTCNLHHLKPDSNDFTSNALGPFFYRLCISTLLLYFLQECTEAAAYSKVQDLLSAFFWPRVDLLLQLPVPLRPRLSVPK